MADAIDASKNPDPTKVAADIRQVIAAIQPAAPVAPAAPAAPAKPIKLSFEGSLDDDGLLKRAAAEVAKRRPGLAGRKIKFSLVAEPAE